MGQAISRVISVLNPIGAATNRQSDLQNSPEDTLTSDEGIVSSKVGSYASFFGTHFLMGGERYDVANPNAYLFGDNLDLELLGNKPVKVIKIDN